MQEFGMLKDGMLVKSDVQLEGYKLIVYADVPEFDQATQYVSQGTIIENDDSILVNVEIKDLEQVVSPSEPEAPTEFVENPPWEDKQPTNEVDTLKAQLETVQGALDFIIMNY
jgi:hypothetical protein